MCLKLYKLIRIEIEIIFTQVSVLTNTKAQLHYRLK